MPAERTSRAVVFVFGFALLGSQAYDVWSSGIDALNLVLLLAGAWFLFAAGTGFGDPDGTVLGFEYGVGEEPTWRLIVLGIATILIASGTFVTLQ